MKKRILSVILAIAVVLCMFPLGMFSAAALSPDEDIMYIGSLNDLKILEKWINEDGLDTVGKTFVLTADIGRKPTDETDWGINQFAGSLGTAEKPFKGTFIGDGHTVWLNNSCGLFLYAPTRPRAKQTSAGGLFPASPSPFSSPITTFTKKIKEIPLWVSLLFGASDGT